MKVYQVMVLDIWNNLWNLGFYSSLNDPELLSSLNEYVQDQTVIDGEEEIIPNFKFEEGTLQEYCSTFGYCFDKEIDFKDGEYIIIKGYIFDYDILMKELKELGE